MKGRYTIYNQNKETYERFGWQGSCRRQSSDELEAIIRKHEAFIWAVYKIKDNATGKIVAANAK